MSLRGTISKGIHVKMLENALVAMMVQNVSSNTLNKGRKSRGIRNCLQPFVILVFNISNVPSYMRLCVVYNVFHQLSIL